MKYYIDLFGCAKNQVDAENMMSCLGNAGWTNVSAVELADLIIVNSCGFIESAKQESINAVINWRNLFPNKKILLTGCLSQRYSDVLPEILTEADSFMGVQDISNIVRKAQDVMCNNKSSAKKISKTRKHESLQMNIAFGDRPLLSLPGSAYVKISEGCNNNCSYCVIPMIRGKLISRSIPEILGECNILLKRGIKELCIIGQDIGAFGTDNTNCDISQEHPEYREKKSQLPQLLNAISKLAGHFWVRLLYIHPNHFPIEILYIMERDKRFLPYFDIPFQHASAKILKAMNRSADLETNVTEKYLELIGTIRSRLPNAVIRSTFMLGFPGETEEDFSELLDFQQKANIDWLGCFEYSREEGTNSYSMKKHVSKKIAKQRRLKIEQCQIPITEKNMERFIGQTMEVLIEEKITSGSDRDISNIDKDEELKENIWLGRLYCQAPDIDGAAVITGGDKNFQQGMLIPCKVINRRGFDLEVRSVL